MHYWIPGSSECIPVNATIVAKLHLLILDTWISDSDSVTWIPVSESQISDSFWRFSDSSQIYVDSFHLLVLISGQFSCVS